MSFLSWMAPARLVSAWLMILFGTCSLPTPASELVHYGLFGNVHVTAPPIPVERTVVLISDSNGWDDRAEELAQALSADGALVLGIDLPEYLKHLFELKDKCAYPAGHFEGMSDWMQHHQGMENFVYPIVLGMGAGANFAYAVAAQAPAGTFSGLVMLGFDHQFRLAKSLCPGDAGAMTAVTNNGDYRIVPVKQLPSAWLPLPFAHGARVSGILAWMRSLRWDWFWPTPQTQQPAVSLAKHISNWQRQNQAALELPEDVADLPLVEQLHQGEFNQRIAIILTGDGGWAGLDIAIAEQLSRRGIDVVGLNTLKFFWQPRKPQEAVDALTRIVGHYGALHPQASFIVIGYSFGAALAPVIINRAQESVQRRILAQVLISPDAEAVFEVKVGDWFGGAHHDNTIPVVPELNSAKVAVICVHGNEEKEPSICNKVSKPSVRVIELAGGHHYNGDYDGLAQGILKALPVVQNSTSNGDDIR